MTDTTSVYKKWQKIAQKLIDGNKFQVEQYAVEKLPIYRIAKYMDEHAEMEQHGLYNENGDFLGRVSFFNNALGVLQIRGALHLNGEIHFTKISFL